MESKEKEGKLNRPVERAPGHLPHISPDVWLLGLADGSEESLYKKAGLTPAISFFFYLLTFLFIFSNNGPCFPTDWHSLQFASRLSVISTLFSYPHSTGPVYKA